MIVLEITLGLLLCLLAWGYFFQKNLIFKINSIMRGIVFNDQVALFSGRRVAILLIVLGGLSLFSGLSGLFSPKEIPSDIAAQIIDQAKIDLKANRLTQVISRCRALVRSNPREARAWEMLVEAWSRKGEKGRARQAAKVLLRLEPKHPFGQSIFNDELKIIEKEKE